MIDKPALSWHSISNQQSEISNCFSSARSMRGGDILQKIRSLPVRSVIPLKNLSVGRNHCGAQGVRNESAFFVVGQGKIVGEFRKLSLRDGGELPMPEDCGIFTSCAGVAIGAQHLRCVIRRIKADAENMSFAVARRVGANLLVDRGELVADTRAEIREGTTCVDESEQQSLSTILMHGDRLAILVDEFEIGNFVTGRRNVKA